jgi:LAO/AO transport system kinase
VIKAEKTEKSLDTTEPKKWAAAIIAGDRRALAKAITLIESKLSREKAKAEELLKLLMPKTGRSLRLGVSGAPGVGKSTFIEIFGQRLVKDGHHVAILAIDPTSPISGGSILGDRTRMESLSRNEKVFIRPSPAGATLGGIARKTRETILACEAAGYDFIIVETVGVGQSETLVHGMVDVLLILQQPHTGDELQGIKRGILELADIVAITKADGDNLKPAKQAQGQLERALMLARGSEKDFPSVVLVSSTEPKHPGIKDVQKILNNLVVERKKSKEWEKRREQQTVYWFHDELGELLRDCVKEHPLFAQRLAKKEAEVRAGKLPARLAAKQLLEAILPSVKK